MVGGSSAPAAELEVELPAEPAGEAGADKYCRRTTSSGIAVDSFVFEARVIGFRLGRTAALATSVVKVSPAPALPSPSWSCAPAFGAYAAELLPREVMLALYHARQP